MTEFATLTHLPVCCLLLMTCNDVLCVIVCLLVYLMIQIWLNQRAPPHTVKWTHSSPDCLHLQQLYTVSRLVNCALNNDFSVLSSSHRLLSSFLSLFVSLKRKIKQHCVSLSSGPCGQAHMRPQPNLAKRRVLGWGGRVQASSFFTSKGRILV